MKELWNPSVPIGALILRATIVYVFLIILIRLSGKRQMGQMSAIEFVVILLISNAVQNAMNGGDNSLTAGLVLSSVLIFLSWMMSRLAFRYPAFAAVVKGRPTLLVHDGKIHERNMAKERLTLRELQGQLREHGIRDVLEVRSAVLEADGSLSVIQK